MSVTVSDASTEPGRARAWPLLPLTRGLILSMRPHQWLKNTFVLAPLLFGQRLLELPAVTLGLTAFISFCLMSSALYLLNDLVDAPADRRHPEKRHRPIAARALPESIAWSAAVVLSAGAIALAAWIGWSFLLLALAYCALAVCYSLRLRQVVLLDVMAIALGFTLRVVAGAVAVQVEPSHWLVICAFLLALYLAVAKRRRELLYLSDAAPNYNPVLQQYSVRLLDQILSILTAAAFISYALYTVAPDTVSRHGTGRLVYGAIFVLYGLLRYLILIQDSRNGGDPSKLLVTDKPLLINTLAWAVFNGLVIYGNSILPD